MSYIESKLLDLLWPVFKAHVSIKSCPIQYIELEDIYILWATDGIVKLGCVISISDPANSDQQDFEDNYKASANAPDIVTVKTQFERDDILLKLARYKETVVDGVATISAVIPSGGRYLSGGWGLIDTYDPDDYANVWLEDSDRIIAAMMGEAAQIGRSLTDEEMQAEGTYPNYPVIESFDDKDLSADNQGWYFWPLVKHDGTEGEVEFEPIGGYANLPEGMYLKMRVTRPNISTGTVRACLFWGAQV